MPLNKETKPNLTFAIIFDMLPTDIFNDIQTCYVGNTLFKNKIFLCTILLKFCLLNQIYNSCVGGYNSDGEASILEIWKRVESPFH